MFLLHGEFNVSFTEKILYVEACGPFNLEAVKGYAADIEALGDKLPGYWGQLNIMQGNCLFTPDAALELNALIKRRLELGLCCIAFIIPDIQAKVIMHQQLVAAYQTVSIKCEFFEQRSEAELWLSQQLSHQAATVMQA